MSSNIDPRANKTYLLKVLEKRAIRRKNIITFPEINRCFSWFRVRKSERDSILYDLQIEGKIKLVPYHGIILTQEVE